MAVTQQLARLDAGRLAAARSSVTELDDVCSFRALPAADYLDLDWAPLGLIKSAEAAAVAPQVVAALKRSLEGDEEVNAEYRDAPDTIWEHPVTALEPGAVAAVTACLATLRAHGFRPRDTEMDLQPFFESLVRFYEEATERGLAMVMWWD